MVFEGREVFQIVCGLLINFTSFKLIFRILLENDGFSNF